MKNSNDTIRLVAQCLNHLRHCVPQLVLGTIRKNIFKIYILCTIVRDLVVTNVTFKLNYQHFPPQPYQHTSKWYYKEIFRIKKNSFLEHPLYGYLLLANLGHRTADVVC